MRRDLLVLVLLAALAIGWLAERIRQASDATSPIRTTALLAAAPENFRRVTGPEPLMFPDDHAMHPGYRDEWWYFTGNLADAEGRRYGFQFTLFRFALAPNRPRPDSDFAAEAVWMAHLAISDIDNRRFFSRERFARGTLELAGASADQWWLRDWTVTRDGERWRLEAGFDTASLALMLDPVKPVVLQGEAGYSRKGPEPGNASRYYSITRIDAAGRLRLGDDEVGVTGQAWLDREWGSSQLGAGIVGWDWFALQLDDGRDLMLYRLRTEGGEASRYSAGALVEADGAYRILRHDDFDLVPTRHWRDRSEVDWPVAWRLRVPPADLRLDVRPAFDAQRWSGAVDYWEGAVGVFDPQARRIGRGYLELSGYAERALSKARRR